MPVDYSKWDALELSDDSDIEVHPNVDKKSFIRAKQNQIHQERASRKHQITTLKYERIINDGLLLRIDKLLTALKSHKTDSATNPDEVVLKSLMQSAGDPKDDKPPTPPEGVHQNTEQPAYSRMMAALIDQVKQEVDAKGTGDRLQSFIDGVTEHKDKVDGLQKQLIAKLSELETEDKKHITSGDLHEGFSHSHVSKAVAAPAPTAKKTTQTELLNPSSASIGDISSGAEADIEDGSIDNPEDVEASPAAKQFGKIRFGDYYQSLQFLQQNPSILTEHDTDGLLVEAFDAQLSSKDQYARQCVHQALLIQYCRTLGRDGVALFFKRITTQGHKAQQLFIDDVNGTYARIRDRAAEIKRQREEEGEAGGVEQIQLHAVDPNTTIRIQVPPRIPTGANAESTDPLPTEEEIAGRKIFESFPPNLQRALEKGSLDAVNLVLGKMSVDEAEEVVAKLSEGGILAVEEGVIDTTTEEGQSQMKEIERTGHMPGVDGGAISEDPPLD